MSSDTTSERLLTMRVASSFDVPLRSWVVDVPDIFHPRFSWPERVRDLQRPGVGEQLLETAREAARASSSNRDGEAVSSATAG
jgi:hypothetical protein